MSLLDRIIRPDVRALTAYHVPDAADVIKLDAMENPFPLPEDVRAGLAQRLTEVAVNRYPVPTYSALKRRLCDTQGVPAGYDLMLGNGSDELIAILSVACAVPGSKVLAPVPGFVMYERSALFAGMEFVGVPLRPDFTLDRDAMLAAMRRHRPAITYLAYPNNPTGTLFPAEDIAELVREADGWGIVVVDEAYQPFAQQTFLPRLPEFPNLVVMRTVSKLGLAGLRLGYLSAAGELLAELEKVRPPYNVNVLTEAAADYLLERADVLEAQAAVLRSERSVVAAALAAMPELEVFPSAANFLLVRLRAPAPSSDEVCARLLKRKILIKNAGKMHPLLENCLRITIGTPQENRQFLDALKASLAL